VRTSAAQRRLRTRSSFARPGHTADQRSKNRKKNEQAQHDEPGHRALRRLSCRQARRAGLSTDSSARSGISAVS